MQLLLLGSRLGPRGGLGSLHGMVTLSWKMTLRFETQAYSLCCSGNLRGSSG